MRVTILGAGSWGLAVALALHRAGRKVTVWAHRSETAQSLRDKRLSTKLPNAPIHPEITISDDLVGSVTGAEAIVFAAPAQQTGALAEKVAPLALARQRFILLSKGIEKGSNRRMSQVVEDTIPAASADNICALSGPSHAEEVASFQPTSVVAASKSEQVSIWTQELFSSDVFRVYRTSDVVGVELGGAVKNIIAIASGITRALGLGDNVQGALITRGLAEMSRLGAKIGADPLTFSGLSGLGDLVTTCFSRHSRNRHVGEQIGSGVKLSDVLSSMEMVAEGVDTCVGVRDLARDVGVETPITEEVYQTLFEGKEPREAVRHLMSRKLKEERWK